MAFHTLYVQPDVFPLPSFSVFIVIVIVLFKKYKFIAQVGHCTVPQLAVVYLHDTNYIETNDCYNQIRAHDWWVVGRKTECMDQFPVMSSVCCEYYNVTWITYSVLAICIAAMLVFIIYFRVLELDSEPTGLDINSLHPCDSV